MKYDNSAVYHSPIGDIILCSYGEKLTGLYFRDTVCFEQETASDVGVLDLTIKWLDIYFSGKKPDFEIPLSLQGSPFQMQVWKHVQQIPYGSTASYGSIARKIAEERGIMRMSNQAVGTAVGRNPISIIIPCHRVIREDGSLGEYGGNSDRKLFLLELESQIKR